jgi:hypothetical protein
MGLLKTPHSFCLLNYKHSRSFDDSISCQKLYDLLKPNVGRSIEEIGGLELEPLNYRPTPAAARSRVSTTASFQTPVDQQDRNEAIEEVDIERSWAEHFPKRLVNGYSKTICAYICLILSHKAQHETAGG